ncbi:hypothetical protein AB0N09_31620 [Streptomyces erythrochromogenes]|uniref:hypothetical protein n=1 Tax=Streptomyces erythrochromogenes TaxID=285574 RepID=UPI00343461D9
MTLPPLSPPPTVANIQITAELMAKSAHALCVALGHAEAMLGQGLDGVGRQQDIAAIKAGAQGPQQAVRLTLYEMAYEAALLAQKSALDHLRSLSADLIREPGPALSHLTLVRAALEAGGLFGYLTERGVDVRLLLARIAGVKLADAINARNLAETHKDRDPGILASQERLMQSFESTLTRAGVIHKFDKKRRKVVATEVEGHATKGDIYIGQAALAFLGSEHAGAYNLLSGGAHSRPWMLGANESAAPAAGSVIYALSLTLALITAWLERWAAYTGNDATPTIKRVRQPLHIVLTRAAAGEFNAT